MFFQKDATFGDNNRHIAVDETLALVIGEGNGDVGILDADIEGDAKDAAVDATWTREHRLVIFSSTRFGGANETSKDGQQQKGQGRG